MENIKIANDYVADIESRLFDDFIEGYIKNGASNREVNEMKIAYNECVTEEKRLQRERSGEYSIRDLERSIPNNPWLLLMKEVTKENGGKEKEKKD